MALVDHHQIEEVRRELFVDVSLFLGTGNRLIEGKVDLVGRIGLTVGDLGHRAAERLEVVVLCLVNKNVAVRQKKDASLLLGLPKAPDDLPLRQAVESEIIDTAKKILQPAYRLSAWTLLAQHYQDTNRPELAQAIIDQHLEEVEKLPSGGWSGLPRSMFAALIVEQDPELAIELTEGMDDRESNRARGRLAFHCCRTNPELALQLLGQQSDDPDATVGANVQIKVCHRMAIEQTESALKLAASIEEPNQRAWAFGVIAMRLNDANPEAAQRALVTAIDSLNTSDQSESRLSSASTTAGLLPIAEKVAPEKMSSLIWQSVYLAIPRSRWNTGGGSKASKIQSAAAAISRYDGAIAAALVGDKEIEIGTDVDRSAANQVALDVAGLPEFLKRLEATRHSGAFDPRGIAIGLLMNSESGFWDTVSKPVFLDWPSDQYEKR